MIQFSQVHKQFGENVVLEDTTFMIEQGETVAIIGFSGAGKSVCLRHMVRLTGPDRGSILIDGTPLERLNRKEMRQMRSRFGVLFQGAALLQWMNVFDNVALPLRERTECDEAEIKERVEQCLEWVGLLEAADRLPSQVSGGMQKRAGLARAIVMNPEILLYDEPTSGLDPVTSRKIDRLIAKTNREQNATSVVVTHDLISAMNIASRILMLHEGRVVEYSTPEDFVCSKVEVVQQFLQAQHFPMGFGSGDDQDGKK
jgi:phospholipid/cholesterol/gamma-HCH transport system ATP-binding protein